MKPLIIALDVETEKEALSLIKATRENVDLYKVGPGLVLRYGPSLLKAIKKRGKKIFLDLKFHDIPTTMLRSIKEASRAEIYSATVHISAGQTALNTVSKLKPRPQIWGVTVLTSLLYDDLVGMGIHRTPHEQASRMAELAMRSEIDGVVASVGEAFHLRQILGSGFKIITPGIRLPDHQLADQKRIATPQHAREAGVDFIVVGRPIIEAKDPQAVTEDILKDWRKGLSHS